MGSLNYSLWGVQTSGKSKFPCSGALFALASYTDPCGCSLISNFKWRSLYDTNTKQCMHYYGQITQHGPHVCKLSPSRKRYTIPLGRRIIFSSWVVFFLIVGHYHFVGAYAGATACLRGHSGSLRGHKFAAYARVVLLRRCPRGYSPGSFSPPARWGLLDFM